MSGAGRPGEQDSAKAPKSGKKRRLRGRGAALGAGGLAAQLKRRAEAAAADAAPHVRALAEQAQRLAAEGAASAREEAERRRPAAEQAAKDALGTVREAAERAKPEAERLAREAVQKGEVIGKALKPQVSRVAQDTAEFAREHEEELRGAAGSAARAAARTAARGATPAPLRPAVDAFERELQRKEGQAAREDAAEATDGTEDTTTPSA